MYFQKDVKDFEGFLVHMSKDEAQQGMKSKKNGVCVKHET